jgi:hypothetical protein
LHHNSRFAFHCHLFPSSKDLFFDINMDHPSGSPHLTEPRNASQGSGATTLRNHDSPILIRSMSSSNTLHTSPRTASTSTPQQYDDEIEMMTISRSEPNTAHPGNPVAPKDVHPGHPTQKPDVIPLKPSKSHPQAKLYNRVSPQYLLIVIRLLSFQKKNPSNSLIFFQIINDQYTNELLSR